MVEYISPITDSPLFFWIVAAYLLLLYHSFDIKEIQDKVRGVELLFISVALGAIFLRIFNSLEPIFNAISNWSINLKHATDLPLTFDPFHEHTLTTIEYYFQGIIVIFIVYTLIAYLILIVVKAIQYCLDPDEIIFSKQKRFAIFTDNKMPEIILSGIPRLIGGIALSLFFIGVDLGYLFNIPEFEFSIAWILQLLVMSVVIILSIIALLLLITIMYHDFCVAAPASKKIYYMLLEYRDKKQSVDPQSDINKSKIIKFLNVHTDYVMYLVAALIFSLSSLQYIEKSLPFFDWIIMSTSSLALIAFTRLYNPK